MANGAKASEDHAGGGSGGAIDMTCKILKGRGIISAVGGNGDSLGGGGSGGRIVLHATKTTLLSFEQGGGDIDAYRNSFPKSHVLAHGGLASGGATSIDGTWSMSSTSTSNRGMTYTCVNCCTRSVCASRDQYNRCTGYRNEAYTCDKTFTTGTVSHNTIDIDTATNAGVCRGYAGGRIPSNVCNSAASCQKVCSDDLYVSGGWQASTVNTAQYAQVDFGKLQYITGLETKGLADPKLAYWVTKYQISWSRDNSNWFPYRDAGATTSHWGNRAQTRGVTHEFRSPFWARYIRIHVNGYENGGIGLQAQFHGYTAGHPSTLSNPSVHPQFRQARFKTCPSGIFLYKGDGSNAKLTANWDLPSAEDTAGTVASGRQLLDAMPAPRSTTWPVIDHSDSMTVSHQTPLLLSHPPTTATTDGPT